MAVVWELEGLKTMLATMELPDSDPIWVSATLRRIEDLEFLRIAAMAEGYLPQSGVGGDSGIDDRTLAASRGAVEGLLEETPENLRHGSGGKKSNTCSLF